MALCTPILPRLAPRASLLGAVLAMSVAVSTGHAQATGTGDLLILMSGGDTVAVERVHRIAGRLDGELLIKVANARFTYSVEVDAEGGATRLYNAYRPASADTASEPVQRAIVRFTGDSAIAEISGGGRSVTQRFATTPAVIPFVNPSFAMVELMLQRARRLGGVSVEVPIWAIQGGTTMQAQVDWRGGDSVVVTIGGMPAHLAVDTAGRIVGGSIPGQGVHLVRQSGTPAAALAVEPPDYRAPAGAPYTAEEVTITTPAGHTLAGTLTLPRGVFGRVPAVVTITGSGPQDRDESLPFLKGYRPMRQIADTLGRHGIAVLRFDDRGTGASTGDHATATSADFADDVRAALAYLRLRPEVDPSRLGLVGHSEGGLIAPMVAVTDLALRAIVLMAGPAQTGREILRYQMRAGIERAATMTITQRDSALLGLDATIDSLGRAQPWMRYFLDYDPLETARRVRVPTLILQGETDRQVTADQAAVLERAVAAGGNHQVTRRVFPEANHLFVQDADGTPSGYAGLPDRHVRADVLAVLLDWLREHLR